MCQDMRKRKSKPFWCAVNFTTDVAPRPTDVAFVQLDHTPQGRGVQLSPEFPDVGVKREPVPTAIPARGMVREVIDLTQDD